MDALELQIYEDLGAAYERGEKDIQPQAIKMYEAMKHYKHLYETQCARERIAIKQGYDIVRRHQEQLDEIQEYLEAVDAIETRGTGV